MTSQRLVEDFAAWLWERDTWPRDRFGDKDCRLPDNYVNEAAVFLAGELGQRLQRGERARLAAKVLAAVRSMPLGYRPEDVADELEHADLRYCEITARRLAQGVLDFNDTMIGGGP